MPEFSKEDLHRIAHTRATSQEIIAILTDGSADLIYSDDIEKEYQNKWVAAFNGERVAVADDQSTLLDLLNGQGIPPALAAVRFVDAISDDEFVAL